MADDMNIEVDMDTDMVIHSTSSLGGLDVKIEASGIPEALGVPYFQLTFFDHPENGHGHVLFTNTDTVGGIPLAKIFEVLQQYMIRVVAAARAGEYGVPQDIVDRFEDGDNT